MYEKVQDIGYRPYVPPQGDKGVPPRSNSRGMDLNTGIMNHDHRLAFANPAMDAKAYSKAIIEKQSPEIQKVLSKNGSIGLFTKHVSPKSSRMNLQSKRNLIFIKEENSFMYDTAQSPISRNFGPLDNTYQQFPGQAHKINMMTGFATHDQIKEPSRLGQRSQSIA